MEASMMDTDTEAAVDTRERDRSPERGQVIMEEQGSLSPERAQPGFSAAMVAGTPERATNSPPSELRSSRNPPDPTDSIVWFPVGAVRARDILDAAEHPATYVRVLSSPNPCFVSREYTATALTMWSCCRRRRPVARERRRSARSSASLVCE
jgi:hypothetical protein